MKGKRTGLDFSKHELLITESEGLLVHHLKKPNTQYDNIRYINTNGIMAVTGDYGNYIFCREFHPSAKGFVSDGYWHEKLRIGSYQKISEFDSEGTLSEIERLIKEKEDYGFSEKDIEFLEELKTHVDDEIEYTYEAYRGNSHIDVETIPFVKKPTVQWNYILDGFDEICRRMKESEVEVKTVAETA